MMRNCPYVSGSAVFKARTLYNTITPMVWSDKYICNAMGVNKNGTTDDEGIIDPLLLSTLEQENIKVYPNPASTNVTIAYSLLANETGELVFYDLLGREHIRTQLSNYSNRVSFSISALPNGIYIYKYLVNGQKRYTNKIVKE